MGWDVYGQQHEHQFYQQQQYVPPVPPPGHNYVPYEQYNTLVTCVGDVENTLHDVNANVVNLTQSFTHFMDEFPNYYPHQNQPRNDGNDE
jgi:hypothetical protein